jgi:hypothetical protein
MKVLILEMMVSDMVTASNMYPGRGYRATMVCIGAREGYQNFDIIIRRSVDYELEGHRQKYSG